MPPVFLRKDRFSSSAIKLISTPTAVKTTSRWPESKRTTIISSTEQNITSRFKQSRRSKHSFECQLSLAAETNDLELLVLVACSTNLCASRGNLVQFCLGKDFRKLSWPPPDPPGSSQQETSASLQIEHWCSLTCSFQFNIQTAKEHQTLIQTETYIRRCEFDPWRQHYALCCKKTGCLSWQSCSESALRSSSHCLSLKNWNAHRCTCSSCVCLGTEIEKTISAEEVSRKKNHPAQAGEVWCRVHSTQRLGQSARW